jgi:malonyl-CoA O-methyltransferase
MSDVIASFERMAPNYLAHAGVQEELAGWLAEWLPRSRTGRALEVGAGPGVFTRRLLPWQGSLIATDGSRAMCAAGRSAWPAATWRTMAAERPLAGPWDWIFSSSMLQWVEDPAAVFTAWRRQLAPGGRVLAGLFAAGSLGEWEELAGGAPLRWRTPDEWRALLSAAGLHVVREGAERRIQHYASATALLRTVHGTGAAPWRRIPPARLRRLLGEYEDRHRTKEGVPASWKFYRLEANLS